MICSAKCSCLLCRELQTCQSASSKYQYKKSNPKMCDNFILKKAEAFESSSAMKFIRGAARLSVRHWQSKEAYGPPRNFRHQPVSKSTSCEQLYPFKKNEDHSSFRFHRAPSSEQLMKLNGDNKPVFKILAHSKLKIKFNNTDSCEENKPKNRGILNFLRNEEAPNPKHVHEKYIPLHISAPILHEHIYSVPKSKNNVTVKDMKLPLYQSVNKPLKKTQNIQISSHGKPGDNIKLLNNRPACYEELSQKLSQEQKKNGNLSVVDLHRKDETRSSVNKITQNNNKVVIYFGDSIVRKHNDRLPVNREGSDEAEKKSILQKNEVIYANRLLEETENLGIAKGQKTCKSELISEISVENEAIYSEITCNDHNEESKTDSTVDGDRERKIIDDATYTCKKTSETTEDKLMNGIINVEFKENFECAKRLVDVIRGKVSDLDEATILESDEHENLDWSFVQDWRKRPSHGSRTVYEDSNLGNNYSTTANVAHLKHVPPLSPGHESTVHNIGHHNNVSGFIHPNKASKVRISANSNHRSEAHHSTLNAPTYHGHDAKQDNSQKLNGYQHYQQREVTPGFIVSVASSQPLNTNTNIVNENHLKNQKCVDYNTPTNINALQRNNNTSDSNASAMRTCLPKSCGPQIKSVTSPCKLTVQSTPVKCQNPMSSYGLERSGLKKELGKDWRVGASAGPPGNAPAVGQKSPQLQQHQNEIIEKDVMNGIQNTGRECNSSSDENRSSGHASMSDSGGGGGGGAAGAGGVRGETEEGARCGRSRASSHHSRGRHRATAAKLQSPWPGGGGLDDIRSAIKQLTLRSRGSTTSTTTSTGTATSCSEGGANCSPENQSARRRRQPLIRHPSLDTVCTNVTSADEFVWVDSHNRLVELQHLPWSAGELQRALHAGRTQAHAGRISADTLPRLAYLLQRALVRIAREAHRLSQAIGLCSKHEVAGALKIVLSSSLADVCIKACLRAATMFAMSGDAGLRQSKASRASLQLSVGKFHRWMVDMRLGKFVHEYAAIYMCAAMETLLEEILLHCLPTEAGALLTPGFLEHAIAVSGDLWGLLQPYAHLNAGRIASGALSISRWTSLSSLGSGGSTHSAGNSTLEHSNLLKQSMQGQMGSSSSQDIGISSNGSGTGVSKSGSVSSNSSLLLTTCVGTLAELRDTLARVPQPPLTPHALRALFYFMRCSQLEHSTSTSNACTNVGSSGSGGGGGGSSSGGVQELWYERAYAVLPPLREWLRVASAHAEHRAARAVDGDDVMQAARLLLPGVDCPPRPMGLEEPIQPRRCTNMPSGSAGGPSGAEESAGCCLALAHRLLLSGRPELLAPALRLLPPGRPALDALDHTGMTVLMKAAAAGDEHTVAMLLEAGANPDVETPGGIPHPAHLQPGPPPRLAGTPTKHSGANAIATAGWTALVYACAGSTQGAGAVAMALLRGGAHVEGGAGGADERCTLTPLQVACGSGNLELVQLLLQNGAQPFLSTLLNDSLCYSGSAQRGCYSAISVCCTHGQRACLRALLAHSSALARPGDRDRDRDVLSLEEILAEGAGPPAPAAAAPTAAPDKFSKTQMRALQEAMYHAAESNHLDMTLELRALGVGWSLHAWMLSLGAAAEAGAAADAAADADAHIDQLLQDFLQVCPSDDSHYGRTFIYDCLPLLFNIFRYSKKEGTILLLADIFCTCYGWEPISVIREPPAAAVSASRIDPKFVNNPELSDVTFRVEGRLFYGHKIVLVTESPRFRSMLVPAPAPPAPASSVVVGEPSAAPETPAQSPVVQIKDIRYHIFQQVMKFLYYGGCSGLDVAEGDVLELLAAASFFQLLPLQRHCEARAAAALHLHNLVSVYIHAKVYNAQQLLEYCQGFLLQNMVALLTYDDSVKRLLFGKRLPGHNVLAALLATLQQRIQSRKSAAKGR